MSFSMRVKTARHYKDWHFVGVTIEEGTFRWGDLAYIRDFPERHVKILSSSIMDTKKPQISRGTTLTIQEPPFPIEDLIGTTLVDRETAYAAEQPSLLSHSKERS